MGNTSSSASVTIVEGKSKKKLELLKAIGNFLMILGVILLIASYTTLVIVTFKESGDSHDWTGAGIILSMAFLVSSLLAASGARLSSSARHSLNRYFYEVRKGDVLSYDHDNRGNFWLTIRGHTMAGEERDYGLVVDVETWRKWNPGDEVDFSDFKFSWEK